MQRRQALKIIASVGITGLSGCSSGSSEATTSRQSSTTEATSESTTTEPTSASTTTSKQTEEPPKEWGLPESRVYTEDPYVIEERHLSISVISWAYVGGVPYFNPSSEDVEILEPAKDVFFSYGANIYNRGGEVKEPLNYRDFFLWVDGESYSQSMKLPEDVEFHQIRDNDQEYTITAPWWDETSVFHKDEIRPDQRAHVGFLFDIPMDEDPDLHYLGYDGEYSDQPVYLGLD